MKQSTMERAWRASALVGALLIGLQAGALAQDKPFAGVTLTIGTFGGAWKDLLHRNIGAELEKQGAKVQWVLGNPRDILAKLVAARGGTPPIDVIEIDDSTWKDLQARGFVQKLDHSKMPNLSDVDPSNYDDHKAAHWITEEGVIYNYEKFREQGIPEPTTLSDLLHPKLKGKVSFPNIMVNTAVNGIVGFAATKGGDETNIDAGLELIKQMDVLTFWNSPPEWFQLMKAGDLWAAFGHAGHAVRLDKAGVPVAMLHPPVKGKVGMKARGYLGITKGSKAVDAAHFFINGAVGVPAQTEILLLTGIVPTNIKVETDMQLRKDNPKLQKFLRLDPKDINAMYAVDHSKVNMVQWNRKWNRMLVK